jgi:uncharacterized membrane protein required for colicin V production
MAQEPAPGSGIDYAALPQQLGWVDTTAATLLFAFFVVGLWKGLFWQTSRIGILVVAWLTAARFGKPFGHEAHRLLTGPGEVPPTDTAVYLAYVALFVATVVLLSLLALVVQKLVAKAGLTFFDRLGGGVLGIGTGACIVMFLVSLVLMFFRDSEAAAACRSSHSHRLSQKAVDLLGRVVPDELRAVYRLEPLRSLPGSEGNGPPGTGPAGTGAASSDGQVSGDLCPGDPAGQLPLPPVRPGRSAIAPPAKPGNVGEPVKKRAAENPPRSRG